MTPRSEKPAASVAELAYAPGLGPGVRKDVEVRLLSLAFGPWIAGWCRRSHGPMPCDNDGLPRVSPIAGFLHFGSSAWYSAGIESSSSSAPPAAPRCFTRPARWLCSRAARQVDFFAVPLYTGTLIRGLAIQFAEVG